MGILRISFTSSFPVKGNNSSLDPCHQVPCSMRYMDNIHNLVSLPFIPVEPLKIFFVVLQHLWQVLSPLGFWSAFLDRLVMSLYSTISCMSPLPHFVCFLFVFALTQELTQECLCLQASCHTLLTIFILLWTSLSCSEDRFCWNLSSSFGFQDNF